MDATETEELEKFARRQWMKLQVLFRRLKISSRVLLRRSSFGGVRRRRSGFLRCSLYAWYNGSVSSRHNLRARYSRVYRRWRYGCRHCGIGRTCSCVRDWRVRDSETQKNAKLTAALSQAIQKLYEVQERLMSNAEYFKAEIAGIKATIDMLTKKAPKGSPVAVR